jgi:hypothetical protein
MLSFILWYFMCVVSVICLWIFSDYFLLFFHGEFLSFSCLHNIFYACMFMNTKRKNWSFSKCQRFLVCDREKFIWLKIVCGFDVSFLIYKTFLFYFEISLLTYLLYRNNVNWTCQQILTNKNFFSQATTVQQVQ